MLNIIINNISANDIIWELDNNNTLLGSIAEDRLTKVIDTKLKLYFDIWNKELNQKQEDNLDSLNYEIANIISKEVIFVPVLELDKIVGYYVESDSAYFNRINNKIELLTNKLELW